MTTAFVFSGGGSVGAVQVGMLQGLVEAGVKPDLVVGASVGAINGVHFAARPTAEGVAHLASLWLDLSRHDVIPLDVGVMVRAAIDELRSSPLRGVARALGGLNHVFPLRLTSLVAAATGRRNHLVDNTGLTRFVADHLPSGRLESSSIPVAVLAADACTGRAVVITTGSTLEAVTASAAIPVLFPDVEVDGVRLMDGELADRTGIEIAVELGAEVVYLLRGTPRPLPSPPATALGMAVHTYNVLSAHRMSHAIARLPAYVRLLTPPSPDTAGVLPLDFTHTSRLIEEAAVMTRSWLRDMSGRVA